MQPDKTATTATWYLHFTKPQNNAMILSQVLLLVKDFRKWRKQIKQKQK